MLGTLCYDAMEILRQIVSDFVDVGSERKIMLDGINYTEEFLKLNHMKHVDKGNDGFNDVNHANSIASG